MECYFDNSATTRTYPEVVNVMNDIMLNSYGNPSSMHRKGMEAEMAVRHARETLALNKHTIFHEDQICYNDC